MTKYILILILLAVITVLIFYNQYKYDYGIVILCHNRPEFLKKTLNSLRNSNLSNTLICIIDDSSTNTETINLVKNFSLTKNKIIKHTNKSNLGIDRSLQIGFDLLYPYCKFMLNIDSDVIVKKNWLQKLKSTYYTSRYTTLSKVIVTGFNCTSSCLHKIIKSYNTFHHKKSIGGINMFFHRSLYHTFFRKILTNRNKQRTKIRGWDWDIVNEATKKNILLIATNPSVVQHIGITGINSSKKHCDIAEDF